MDNEYTRKENECPIFGNYCDREDKKCNICVSQEEAWERVQGYIECHSYTWTYEHLKHDYQEYYTKGAYISHTCRDVIENNLLDCKLLFE